MSRSLTIEVLYPEIANLHGDVKGSQRHGHSSNRR